MKKKPGLNHSSANNKSKRIGQFFLLIVLFLSSLNSIGYIFNISVLQDFHAPGTSMRLITAVCFILTASVLLSLNTEVSKRLFGMMTGFVIASAGAVTFVNYISVMSTGHESSLESLPFLKSFLSLENRMAIVTSMLFVLSGTIIIVLSGNNSKAPGFAHILTIPVFVLGYFIPMGFLVGITSIFSIIDHTGVSIITGINFCLFSLAVFLYYPDTWFMKVFFEKFAGGNMIRKLALSIFIGPLVLTWLIFNAEKSGLFDSNTGIVLIGVIYTIFFLILVWLVAKSANRIDEKRYEIEENLRKSENDYRQLVESANSIIIRLDKNGIFRFVNDYAVTFFGYNKKEELIGKDVSIILPEKETSGRDISHLFEEVVSRPQNYQVFDNENIKKNGDLVWISWANRPIFDRSGNLLEILSIGNDYTEHRRLEKEALERADDIRKSEEILKQAGMIANLGAWEIEFIQWDDINKNPLHWSDQTFRIFGYAPGSVHVTSSLFMELVHPEDREELTNALTKALEERSNYRIEHRIRRNDGIERIVVENAEITYDTSGKPARIIGTVQDITEQKLVERNLTKAKEKAEESDRLKSAFIANLSHEIRTPMNGILGFADLLYKPNLSEESQKMYVDAITSSGKRMLDIINDLINISKLEAGQMDIKIEIVDINQVLDELFIFFLPEANKKGVMLKSNKELSPDKLLIETDKTKLMQILTNLIKNALKFTSKGYVEFGCKLRDDNYLFFVKDTGIGVKKEFQDEIFERFRQGEVAPSDIYEGTGLGLAISKAYVELLGGRIFVESEPSQGSLFSFTVPVKEVKDVNVVLPDQAEKAAESSFTRDGITCSTILIAEDDESVYFYLQQLLMLSKIETIHARNGLEAVEIIKSNHKIDLILMDLKMPKLGGLEATRQIKSIRPSIPIIAQSAFNTEVDIQSAFDAGCNDYISKPFDRKSLLEKIARHCES